MPKWDRELRIIDLYNAPCESALWPAAESETDAEILVAAHNADIDALTAERDELQAIIVAPPGLNEWSHDGDKITAIYSHRPAYAKSEADAKYLVRCHNHNLQMIHERECERDELQRRLDAVVASLKPDGPPIPGGMFDKEVRVLWRAGIELHTKALAIAEGRDNE